jgi:hypothetical protein
MSGPWLKLAEMLGGQVGRKMGKVVSGDLKQFEKIEGWGHVEKINDLATDKGLSPSYLKDLVKQSSDKEHFAALKKYLSDPERVSNIPKAQHGTLLKAVKEKLTYMEDQEIMQQLIQTLKEHVSDIL